MSASSSSSAQQAREALGLRLREIRVEAGLTASALAALMGRHHAKVSRIEHGSAAPSEADIRAWCKHCGVPGQIPDLLATLRAVETMWVEWRRMEQAGLRHAQEAIWPLYALQLWAAESVIRMHDEARPWAWWPDKCGCRKCTPDGCRLLAWAEAVAPVLAWEVSR